MTGGYVVSVLNVENVSIRYITGDFKDIGLKEYVVRKVKGNYRIDEFWANREINFSLEKGDMLGIIGTNGAGKSTLLKAVSGIMEPTRGWVQREGKIAALLELASGFDGDLTVRENTYLRGAMLGYTRAFMDEKYDQIVDFAELQDFQDKPFRQLSSGMKSRLAFSIASLVQPDILILDEVLSVGDGAFRKKSAEKMKEIIRGGATTILVSHSIEQIQELCNKVLWLHEGIQIEFGNDVEGICNRYQQFLSGKVSSKQLINASRQINHSSNKAECLHGIEHTEVHLKGNTEKICNIITKLKNLFKLDLSCSKLFLCYTIILTICSICLLFVCSIPNENICKNIETSAVRMVEESTYPRLIPESMKISTYYRIDNWTEAALLNMIYTNSSSDPVKAAFSQKEYRSNNPNPDGGVGHLIATVNGADLDNRHLGLRSTYWLGVRTILMPLLTIMDYYSIRLCLLFINFCLIFAITFLLSFKVDKSTGIAFFISILMLNFYTSVVQWCNGFPCIWIVSFTIFIILKRHKNYYNFCLLFFIVGMLTSYFDWFSIPLITFGIPAIIILIIDSKDVQSTISKSFNKIFQCAFGWSLGYASMLASRVILTTILNGDGSWNNFWDRVIYNITSSNVSQTSGLSEKLDTLIKGFRGIFPLPMLEKRFSEAVLIGIIVFVLLLIIFWGKRIPVLSILGLVSLAPFVWFIVFNGYCRVHFWIAYRVFLISVFSWILIFRLVLKYIYQCYIKNMSGKYENTP